MGSWTANDKLSIKNAILLQLPKSKQSLFYYSVPNMDETMWQIYSLDLEKICAFGFLLFADSYLANCLKISHLLGFSYCNNLFGPFCLPFWTADTKYKVVFTNYVCRHGRYFLRNLIIFCEEVLSWYKRNMHFWCKGNE